MEREIALSISISCHGIAFYEKISIIGCSCGMSDAIKHAWNQALSASLQESRPPVATGITSLLLGFLRYVVVFTKKEL